jgi:hypothetical protein
MLSHVYNKQLLAKAKVTRLFSSALMFNNLTDNYTLINLTEQVIRNNVYL